MNNQCRANSRHFLLRLLCRSNHRALLVHTQCEQLSTSAENARNDIEWGRAGILTVHAAMASGDVVYYETNFLLTQLFQIVPGKVTVCIAQHAWHLLLFLPKTNFSPRWTNFGLIAVSFLRLSPKTSVFGGGPVLSVENWRQKFQCWHWESGSRQASSHWLGSWRTQCHAWVCWRMIRN